MENNENEIEKDEIVNPEQFQVGRSPQEEKEEPDDADYTEDEVQFADGEGTQLAESFDTSEEDELDEELPDGTEDDELDDELPDDTEDDELDDELSDGTEDDELDDELSDGTEDTEFEEELPDDTEEDFEKE